MRVLFSTTAGAGHFGPLIPVARACAAAGWDVAVAAPSTFSDTVRGAGLDHLPFPDAPQEQMRAVFGGLADVSPVEADRVVMVDVFGRLDAQAALPALLPIMADWKPDLVVREPCEFGSLVAAECVGVPQVQVAIGMARLSSAFTELLQDPLAELCEAAGLPAGRAAQRFAELDTLSSVPPSLDASDVGLLTREFGHPIADDACPIWRYRTDPSSTAALPPAWGDQDLPLVYVSYGSVLAGAGHVNTLYAETLEALAEQPVRVLMTTGNAFDLDAIGSVPVNARVERWWPQADVMPAASAMIGHGGFGTTMMALAAGVPQVIVPLFAADQHQHAAQVAAVGAGVRLSGYESLADLPVALSTVLDDPNFAVQAGAVAAEIATLPDLSTGLSLLESVAATRRLSPLDG
jgi:glycosyltransferase